MLSQSKAYETLAEIYDEREKAIKRFSSNKKKIIGCIGHDVPEEILMAAGYLTVKICGDSTIETPKANQYLELAFDPSVRTQFERLMNGTYDYLDRIVFSNSSDVMIRLYYYMRQIRRVESHLLSIPLYFFDIKFSKFRSSTLYNRERLKEMISAVETWTGKDIRPEALEEAIEICNENRALILELQELRMDEEPKVTGLQALKAMGAGQYMPKDEHNKLLRSFIEEVKARPVDKGEDISGTRVYMSGSYQEEPDLYELVEACGGQIVGEDHDGGVRLFMGPKVTSKYPVDSLVDFYQTRFPSIKKSHVKERIEVVSEHINETGAECAIYFIGKSDDATSWDYPQFKAKMDELGIPVLLLEKQEYHLNNKEALKSMILEFFSSISHEGKEA